MRKEDLFQVLKKIRTVVACSYGQSLHDFESPAPGAFQGLCGYARDLTYFILQYLGVQEKDMILEQGSFIWGRGVGHAFLVLVTDDGTPFVIDLTLSQFLDQQTFGDFTPITRENYRVTARHLIKKGFFNLNSNPDLQLYRKLLGYKGDRSLYIDRQRLLDRTNQDELDWSLAEFLPKLAKCTETPEVIRWLKNYKLQNP
jgi:hypothetical protein